MTKKIKSFSSEYLGSNPVAATFRVQSGFLALFDSSLELVSSRTDLLILFCLDMGIHASLDIIFS